VPLPAPPRIGNLQLSSPLVLAPMSGRTDLAFRAGLRAVGGLALAFTDLTSPHGVLRRNLRTSQILASCQDDRPLGIQLYGSDPELLAEAARRLEAELSPDLIDLNMGCPVHKVTRRGAGSALMGMPELAARIVAQVVRAVDVPVTAKLRLGLDSARLGAPRLAGMLRDAGISALTVHGRTAAQRYSGPVNLEGIRSVVQCVPGLPVFANGDVVSHRSATETAAATGAAGLAIGRAAMRNPWIFKEIMDAEAGRPLTPPSRAEVIEFMRGHFRRLVGIRGEFRGCRQFRKWVRHYGSLLNMSRAQRERFVRISRPVDFENLAGDLGPEL
jgi:nifR3 family TIM-barrel protein